MSPSNDFKNNLRLAQSTSPDNYQRLSLIKIERFLETSKLEAKLLDDTKKMEKNRHSQNKEFKEKIKKNASKRFEQMNRAFENRSRT